MGRADSNGREQEISIKLRNRLCVRLWGSGRSIDGVVSSSYKRGTNKRSEGSGLAFYDLFAPREIDLDYAAFFPTATFLL